MTDKQQRLWRRIEAVTAAIQAEADPVRVCALAKKWLALMGQWRAAMA